MPATDLADAYFGLLDDLRTIVAMPVDLVMHDAIRNEYVRTSIDRERRPLSAPVPRSKPWWALRGSNPRPSDDQSSQRPQSRKRPAQGTETLACLPPPGIRHGLTTRNGPPLPTAAPIWTVTSGAVSGTTRPSPALAVPHPFTCGSLARSRLHQPGAGSSCDETVVPTPMTSPIASWAIRTIWLVTREPEPVARSGADRAWSPFMSLGIPRRGCPAEVEVGWKQCGLVAVAGRTHQRAHRTRSTIRRRETASRRRRESSPEVEDGGNTSTTHTRPCTDAAHAAKRSASNSRVGSAAARNATSSRRHLWDESLGS